MATTKPRTGRRKARTGKKVLFMQKPSCTTCRKAKKFMERRGFQLYFRDLAKERLSSTEIEKLIGKRDYTQFLNPRNEVYRKENMKEEPPTRKQAIRMMAQEPNLIRRPVIVAGGRVVVGFDEDGIARL
ncbi:MAG TPA: ArsC/Spx/MgsR family protein [Candidatus Acidoferrales bacterium]|nr:ArsC/Spx/MgsR family protein [Candidatus Acidoferrales bacterium]